LPIHFYALFSFHISGYPFVFSPVALFTVGHCLLAQWLRVRFEMWAVAYVTRFVYPDAFLRFSVHHSKSSNWQLVWHLARVFASAKGVQGGRPDAGGGAWLAYLAACDWPLSTVRKRAIMLAWLCFMRAAVAVLCCAEAFRRSRLPCCTPAACRCSLSVQKAVLVHLLHTTR
jgi:hypothetical protein